MNKEEALKKWGIIVENWKRSRNSDPDGEINIWAIANVKEYSYNFIYKPPKDVPEPEKPITNSVDTGSKKIDDGWKPWPPQNFNDIKLGVFEICCGEPGPLRQREYEVVCHEFSLEFPRLCPVWKVKFWRQDG
jgi:hypothetical protein